MEWTQIPHLEEKVSRIGLGTWAIGGWMWGGTKEDESIRTIHQALDLGINLIDTAPVYGFGTSEKVVGKALKLAGKRNQTIIATKAGINWQEDKVFRDCQKERIRKEIEDSLSRLQVETIDLYQVHWPDPLVPIRETAEVLLQLQKEGKIRAIGVSNYQVSDMEEFQRIAPISSLQSPYNLFEREIEQAEFPYCKKQNIAILGYGSLCRGLLTSGMNKNRKFLGDDLRNIDPKFQEPRLSQYLAAKEQLEKWALEKYQRPLLALAVRYVLDKGINIALWGARKPQQLNDLQMIEGWQLSLEDFKEIDEIIHQHVLNPVGPQFMAPPNRGESKKFAA